MNAVAHDLEGEPLQSAAQFAESIGKSVDAVRRECRKGWLPATQLGGRWFVRVSRLPYPPSEPPVSSATLDVLEVASRLDLSPEKVRRLCERGEIPAEKVSARWRISATEVSGFARASEVLYAPAPRETGPQRLLGVREAAIELGWDLERVRLFCERGDLPAERVGSRGRWRIPAQALADVKEALSNGRNGHGRRMRGGRRL